ncbi:MBL fold metallo-hydrolase [Gordonia sp. (in: high G+C Gram-positive bacteria)]|uniref:MBL fold metallo-hydrolase n=1 Tax=Gordonia sp. (in: high G+C Gram-positive bacteria) TaxID=84139 RepID=UPI003C770867
MFEKFILGDIVINTIVDFPDQEWPAGLLIPSSDPRSLDDSRYAPVETYNSDTGGLRLKFGGYLFETLGKVVLVDCGVGAQKMRTPHPDWNMREDASFIDSLRQCGYKPSDIDIVIITHAHVDHVGWLTVRAAGEWEPTFPNAKHVFSRVELDYVLDEYQSDPDVNFGSTGDSVVPLLGRVEVVRAEDGYHPVPGVTVRVYPGHTPGNSAIWLESGGEVAVICGDTVHHPIQLRYPEWSSGFCLDPHESSNGRRRLLNEVVDRRAYLLPSHFRLGPVRLRRSGDHYDFCLNFDGEISSDAP